MVTLARLLTFYTMKFVLAVAVVCSVLAMSLAGIGYGKGALGKTSCILCKSPVWARPYCPCGNVLDNWGCPTLCCRSCKKSYMCPRLPCPLCPLGRCHNPYNGCPTCACRRKYPAGGRVYG
ncbi:cysteine-rich motor neuron 1 protein-like [Gigantopelta aegis]|uniref:cysteine-rich motor neuron 1 protein-like n=1 Tax=Gigantopelta aegis TaxID=1735272 RepID=UPI001B88DE89|nr:cysteine-rich motor neuron 1 protein-like [Gigantopelta aegis]